MIRGLVLSIETCLGCYGEGENDEEVVSGHANFSVVRDRQSLDAETDFRVVTCDHPNSANGGEEQVHLVDRHLVLLVITFRDIVRRKNMKASQRGRPRQDFGN